MATLGATQAEAAIDALATVLVDAVAGGASVSFLPAFPHAAALADIAIMYKPLATAA